MKRNGPTVTLGVKRLCQTVTFGLNVTVPAGRLSVQPSYLSVPLFKALDRLTDEGRAPLCVQRPEQWGPDAKPSARTDAAEACSYCPALHPCAAYADAANERHGVWGGVDRSQRQPTTGRRSAA
jgi:transcription factor WhiB